MNIREAMRHLLRLPDPDPDPQKATLTSEETRSMIRERQAIQEARLRGLDIQAGIRPVKRSRR